MLIAFLELLNFGGFDGGGICLGISMKQLWNGVSVRGAAAESERGTAIWRRPTARAVSSSSGLPTFAYSFAQHNFFMASR